MSAHSSEGLTGERIESPEDDRNSEVFLIPELEPRDISTLHKEIRKFAVLRAFATFAPNPTLIECLNTYKHSKATMVEDTEELEYLHQIIHFGMIAFRYGPTTAKDTYLPDDNRLHYEFGRPYNYKGSTILSRLMTRFKFTGVFEDAGFKASFGKPFWDGLLATSPDRVCYIARPAPGQIVNCRPTHVIGQFILQEAYGDTDEEPDAMDAIYSTGVKVFLQFFLGASLFEQFWRITKSGALQTSADGFWLPEEFSQLYQRGAFSVRTRIPHRKWVDWAKEGSTSDRLKKYYVQFKLRPEYSELRAYLNNYHTEPESCLKVISQLVGIPCGQGTVLSRSESVSQILIRLDTHHPSEVRLPHPGFFDIHRLVWDIIWAVDSSHGSNLGMRFSFLYCQFRPCHFWKLYCKLLPGNLFYRDLLIINHDNAPRGWVTPPLPSAFPSLLIGNDPPVVPNPSTIISPTGNPALLHNSSSPNPPRVASNDPRMVFNNPLGTPHNPPVILNFPPVDPARSRLNSITETETSHDCAIHFAIRLITDPNERGPNVEEYIEKMEKAIDVDWNKWMKWLRDYQDDIEEQDWLLDSFGYILNSLKGARDTRLSVTNTSRLVCGLNLPLYLRPRYRYEVVVARD